MARRLAQTSQQRAFNWKGNCCFQVPQVNDKRGKEGRKEAFLWIFASASSSAGTRTFFHKSRVLDTLGLAVALESGTITVNPNLFELITCQNTTALEKRVFSLAGAAKPGHMWAHLGCSIPWILGPLCVPHLCVLKLSTCSTHSHLDPCKSHGPFAVHLQTSCIPQGERAWS